METLVLLSLWALWFIALPISIPIASIRFLFAIFTNPKRAWSLAVSADQFINTVLNGDPDETLSSRSARAQEKGKRWGCVLCKLLDYLEKDHCQKSKGI